MAKKNNQRLVKIKRRFGSFEVRLSELKVEVEDYALKQTKHVYGNMTKAYALFLSLLIDVYFEDGKRIEKSEERKEDDLKLVEKIVHILATTSLVIESPDFFNGYFNLLKNYISKDRELQELDESEDEILQNMKTELDAKEVLNEKVQDDIQSA